MFHIGGIGWTFLGLWHGATTILVSEFDAAAVLDLLERERVTNAVFVPTILQMLTSVPGAAERDYSALRSIAYGASPITTPVLKAALRTFGCPLFGVYGLTETTGGVVQLDPATTTRTARASTCCARPGGHDPWIELRVVDPDSGARARAGGGRRGVDARPERDGRLRQPARRRRPRRSRRTAGCAPATAATSTRRATCSSPTGSRT